MKRTYRRLMRRMLTSAWAVSLVPLWVLGALIYFYFSDAQEKHLRTELKNMAANRVNALGIFLDERTTMLELLAHSAPLSELIKPGTLESLFRLLNRRQWSFVDLGIIDTDGKHLVYSGAYPLKHQQYQETKWFQQTMLRGAYVSDVFLGFRESPHFVVAVRKGDSPGAWILRATIDSDVFTWLVRTAQLGQRGDAYIVNREGKYQTPPRFGGDILSMSDLDLKSAPREISVVDRVAADGRRLLTAFAWLPKRDWILVIDQDPDEALGPLRLAQKAELAILILGSILLAVSIFFLVQFVVRRVEAKDKERATLDAQLAHTSRLVSLGRMAAGVAHEINNPVAAISELAGLNEDLMDEEFVKHYPHGKLFKENLAKIQHHVDRVQNVTHRMLGFARRMEPHLDMINVNDVVNEAFFFLEREAGFRRIKITRELGADLPEIKTDQSQLQQVFMNLLSNALDAVGEGGRVGIETREEGEVVVVTVKDNGPGIPIEFQDSVFDPFFTTKAPGQGTGLGLSISHSIMQNLGGTLTFESVPGWGTNFTVRLPKGPGLREKGGL